MTVYAVHQPELHMSSRISRTSTVWLHSWH